MNPFGSYRALLANSISALCAAVEIFNKPRIAYRDECTVILLVNAWELALKAVLSKHRQRIFYKKKKGQPYRTYSLADALNKVTPYFPVSVDFGATAKNLELLVEYRDNAVHFYNASGFGVLVYALAQTAVSNLSDTIKEVFNRDLSAEVSITLQPLALGTPVDPIAFVRASHAGATTPKSVRQFTERLKQMVELIEAKDGDTGRLLTVFHVLLQSTKKIAVADFVVGVDGMAGGGAPVLVHKVIDPNSSHPFRESDIISSQKRKGLGLTVGDAPLTQYPFRAVTHFLNAKEDPKYCWRDETGAVTRYSHSYIDRLK